MGSINEIVLFETDDKEVTLSVPMDGDTVWLSQAQMTELFNVDRTVITRHVNNIFKEKELIRESNVQKMHIANADRPVQFYTLDVIISVGYRVKSKRGIEFRQWANKILKQYMIDGYVINEKRLHALQKTVDIQTRMLVDALNVEEKDILKAVSLYTDVFGVEKEVGKVNGIISAYTKVYLAKMPTRLLKKRRLTYFIL